MRGANWSRTFAVASFARFELMEEKITSMIIHPLVSFPRPFQGNGFNDIEKMTERIIIPKALDRILAEFLSGQPFRCSDECERQHQNIFDEVSDVSKSVTLSTESMDA